MTKPLILILVCLLGICLADPVVVVDKDMEQPIVDMDDLLQHLAENKQVQSYVVEGFEGAPEELVTLLKELLRQADLEEEDVSSFLSDHKKFEDRVENEATLDIEEAVELLKSKAEGVFMFKSNEQQQKARILHGAAQNSTTDSQLFINMTPATLSALFVTLFLIVMLLIGITCLYNIKTNDKFGKNNLWVGKES